MCPPVFAITPVYNRLSSLFLYRLSPAYRQQLVAEQDELKEANEKLSRRQSAKGVQQHAATMTPMITDMINALLYERPAVPAQQEVFIEITAKALLLKYVQDSPAEL